MTRVVPGRLVLLGAALLFLGTGPARAATPVTSPAPQDAAPAGVTNAMCPVLTDEAVDPDVHTSYRGEEVYFCCRKCLKKFEADPDAYLANLPQDAEQDHHDHAAHGSAEGGGLVSAVSWLGRFHPMVVHFPIALLLLAALAELVVLRSGRPNFAFAARFCLWAGALGALVAASLGWMDALGVAHTYHGFPAELLLYHRWMGTGTAAVAALALLACERFQRTSVPLWRSRYRTLLFASVLMVSVTGHLGAALIFGWSYLVS